MTGGEGKIGDVMMKKDLLLFWKPGMQLSNGLTCSSKGTAAFCSFLENGKAPVKTGAETKANCKNRKHFFINRRLLLSGSQRGHVFHHRDPP